jgi:hypothetical protein
MRGSGPGGEIERDELWPNTGTEEDRGFVNRTDVLLLGGAGLLTGAFQRLQDNAVETTRRNMALSFRRRVGRSRRLVRDTGAILQLVIAVVMLTQGVRAALRQGPQPTTSRVSTSRPTSYLSPEASAATSARAGVTAARNSAARSHLQDTVMSTVRRTRRSSSDPEVRQRHAEPSVNRSVACCARWARPSPPSASRPAGCGDPQADRRCGGDELASVGCIQRTTFLHAFRKQRVHQVERVEPPVAQLLDGRRDREPRVGRRGAPGECGDEPVAPRLGEGPRRSGDPLDLAVEVDVGRPPAALDDRAIRTRPRTHQRNGRDSNPRRRKPRPLSRRLHSSTLPPFRSRGYRATLRGSQERCQSGRMGRPAKALIVVMRSVGSNPTLSATRPARRHGAPVGRFSRRVHRRPE